MSRAAAALPDVIGAIGTLLVMTGVYDLWGRGWTMLVAGGLLTAVYVWRELRSVRRRRA